MKHITSIGAYEPIKPESLKQFVLAELRHAHRRLLAMAAELEVIGTSLREDIITSDMALDWAEENVPGCLGFIPGCIRTATITHANDYPEGPLFSFKSEVHDFGTDEDGDPISVNIVSSDPVSISQGESLKRDPRLTESQEAMLRLLRDAGPQGLSGDDWNAKAREAGIGINRRSTLVNLKGQLRDKGLVREYNGTWNAQK